MQQTRCGCSSTSYRGIVSSFNMLSHVSSNITQYIICVICNESSLLVHSHIYGSTAFQEGCYSAHSFPCYTTELLHSRCRNLAVLPVELLEVSVKYQFLESIIEIFVTGNKPDWKWIIISFGIQQSSIYLQAHWSSQYFLGFKIKCCEMSKIVLNSSIHISWMNAYYTVIPILISSHFIVAFHIGQAWLTFCKSMLSVLDCHFLHAVGTSLIEGTRLKEEALTSY